MHRLLLTAIAALLLLANFAPGERKEVIYFIGPHRSQSITARQYVENECLGAFIDRVGGIIRNESDHNGKRGVHDGVIIVTRIKDGVSQKVGRFKFEKDDALAWNFILEPNDIVQFSQYMWSPPDDFALEDLKFPPAKFEKPKPDYPSEPPAPVAPGD